MHDEAFGVSEEATVGERARRDARLDALDERRVLAPDGIVELEQLRDPRLLDVRAEEVVEEPVACAARTATRSARSRGSARPETC